MAMNLTEYRGERHILVCRLCETHLALETKVIGKSAVDEQEPWAVLSHMDNIKFGQDYSVAENYVRTPVACEKCSRLLGCRVVSQGEPASFFVNTRKLLLRSDDMVLDANTGKPIVGNGKKDILHFNIAEHGNFYQCRQCQAHIAVHDSHLTTSPDGLSEIFYKTVNTHMGLFVERDNGYRTASVHCSVCYEELGSFEWMNARNIPETEIWIDLNVERILYRS